MDSGCGDVLSLEDLKTAKKHQIFEAEVITGKTGGVAGGANIDYATNTVTGQVQKTMPAILRDLGFRPATFDFDTGGTIGVNERDLAVLWPAPGGDGDWYYWEGALPKVIPASSTPQTTGGVKEGAWRPAGDTSLRGNLVTENYGILVDDSNIETKQPSQGGVSRTQHQKNADSISIADFGALPNNTDCTSAIQAAIDYATLNGFGEVYFPAGVWLVESGLSISSNVAISGAGVGATRIKFTAINTVLFDVGDGTNNPNNVYISDMHILVANVSTDGPLIRFRNGYNCGLQRCRVDGPWSTCVLLVGGAQQFIYRIENCVINGETTSYNNIVIGDHTALVQDVFLSNLVLGGHIQGVQVLEQFSSGVYANNIDCLNAKYGWAWIPETSSCYCKGSFYTAVLGDTNAQHGLVMDPPEGAFICDLNLNGCWASSAGDQKEHSGLYINGEKGTVSNINFNGVSCVNNQGSGIEIVGTNCYGINIVNPDCSNNSQNTRAYAHGISLGSGVSRVNISNGHCGGTQGLGENLQGYGIHIAEGAGDHIHIANMDLIGNITGPLLQGATGGGVRVTGCNPYRTTNRGSAKIAAGQTSITVDPGVSSSLNYGAVQVSPTTYTGNIGWWFEQNGSTFTIKMVSAPSSDHFFNWAVDVSQAPG